MTGKTRIVAFVCLLIVTPAVFPQQYRVDPHNMYERILAVVPVVGKGTFTDPDDDFGIGNHSALRVYDAPAHGGPRFLS